MDPLVFDILDLHVGAVAMGVATIEEAEALAASYVVDNPNALIKILPIVGPMASRMLYVSRQAPTG